MKCLVCSKELKNTDYYCSLGCAFKGIKEEANSLDKMFGNPLQQIDDIVTDTFGDKEDEAFARECEREKNEQVYINNNLV